ncbi:MAG: hypothetical protein ACPGD5_00310 [Salibacteraceae bacterium]
MKAASIREIKTELGHLSQQDLAELVLKLARFKKENKELLTYVLFESHDESQFIEMVKEDMEIDFADMNRTSYFLMKKTIRKVLRNIKKNIRYSKKKETEIELLIHFCQLLKHMTPSMDQNRVIYGIYMRQLELAKKGIASLHEDLQCDFNEELEKLI